MEIYTELKKITAHKRATRCLADLIRTKGVQRYCYAINFLVDGKETKGISA